MREPDLQDGRRVAALTVHALCEEDQAWVLDQLPSEDRMELAGWLSELRALGVPADAQLLSLAKGGGGEPAVRDIAALQNVPLPPADRAAVAASISEAHLAQLAQCLLDEPPATARACLSAYDDAERAALLALMPSERAVALREPGRAIPATAVELREAIRSCLMQQALRSTGTTIHV